MESIKILLVDDHKLFREGLTNLIKTFSLPTIIFPATNGLEAIEFLKDQSVDLIILDIQMPVLNGIQVMKKLKASANKSRVIVLTQFDEESLIIHLFQLGANAFMSKNCDADELQSAITAVIKEGHYFNNAVLACIGKSISRNNDIANLEISNRELQIMLLLKDGNSNKEIAYLLSLTLHTIESYRKALLKKMKCRSAAEVISLAYRTGIVAR